MGEKILMKGNEVIAEAALRAGCRHYFGYPIRPQTEVAHYMAKKMEQIGGSFVQAESEVAAINMVYGAASAGVRVMTSSSSPGISLKQEGISYSAGAELPMVIVDIVRAGPGLGGILPAQCDYFKMVKGGGHGDYHNIVLAPSSVQEMYELALTAQNAKKGIDETRQWLSETRDVSSWDDEKIKTENTGTNVFVRASIQIQDAIADLKFGIYIE